MVYAKLKKKLPLKPQHFATRMEWTKAHMSWTDQWVSVLFSDEKKWNLDGPDGCACYWHDLRKEPRSFHSRQQGGGAVMVWGAFGFNGITSLAFVSGRQKSKYYQETLKSHLLPFGSMIGGETWIFQQDNAPIHTSNDTQKWLKEQNITNMKWRARSPDLNPIENLWGIMARRVYASSKQYESVQELQTAIEDCWYNLEPTVLQKLIMSLNNRVFDVIKANGKYIGR